VIELAFRGRVSMQKDSSRRRFPLADRVIEVIDDTLTGEVLLDEALKMMKASEKMSVSSWIDLMSGMAFLYSLPWDLHPENQRLTYLSHRRDMEPHEDRIPIEAGSRTIGEGFSRQRNPSNREEKLPPLRYGNTPCGRWRSKGGDSAESAKCADPENCRSACEPVPP
jgi:hypothetical protein